MPCPDSPNCVSSQSDPSDPHYMEPMTLGMELGSAQEQLKAFVLSMPGSKLISEENCTLHFTFTTRIMRFVDDVHFIFDPSAGLIHFRSASRVGYSDLGANRRRMKRVASEWERKHTSG
ncbi:MAG: DUF1499 domain-containing protein [Proteobacteria bacterium]|nr:DUF1499 domain-containing protein [Pseudomonadota bacterium]